VSQVLVAFVVGVFVGIASRGLADLLWTVLLHLTGEGGITQ
jgi:hypothetical protein